MKCVECGKEVVGKKANAKFCSHACRNRNWCKGHPRVKA